MFTMYIVVKIQVSVVENDGVGMLVGEIDWHKGVKLFHLGTILIGHIPDTKTVNKNNS